MPKRRTYGANEISVVLEGHASQLKKAWRAALPRAVRLARDLLENITPKDTGKLSKGWKKGHSKVYNESPYAGVIEEGARPHKVSLEGIENIKQWAMRVLGADEKEAKNIAYGVAKKIEAVGSEGTYFIRDAIPTLSKQIGFLVMQEMRGRI